jgi:hypothetical protein
MASETADSNLEPFVHFHPALDSGLIFQMLWKMGPNTPAEKICYRRMNYSGAPEATACLEYTKLPLSENCLIKRKTLLFCRLAMHVELGELGSVRRSRRNRVSQGVTTLFFFSPSLLGKPDTQQ